MEYILQIKNLHKSYHKNLVINDLNMNVPKGSIYGFVGQNGAGKTTTMRLVCGLQTHDSGEINLGFNDRRKIGAIIEAPALNLEMTAKENMLFQFDLIGRKDYNTIDDVLESVGLGDTGKKIAKKFSLGMKQRLGIAMALCYHPEILLLDEPTNGLDPQGIIEIRNLLLTINQKYGITIVVSSHILEELSKIATHYGFIHCGRMVRELSAEELFSEMQTRTELHVNNIEKAQQVLQAAKYKFDILGNTIVVIGDVVLTDIVVLLHQNNIVVQKAISKDENLEEFFLKTIGGKSNV